VTTPVTTAAFDEPPAFEAPFDPARDDDPLLPREDAAEERRLDALELFGLLLALFGLLRALEALLRELEALLPLEDVLRVLLRDALLFGLDPLELREVVFLLLCDRELVWAISPP
jgi:hypothetical protein